MITLQEKDGHLVGRYTGVVTREEIERTTLQIAEMMANSGRCTVIIGFRPPVIFALAPDDAASLRSWALEIVRSNATERWNVLLVTTGLDEIDRYLESSASNQDGEEPLHFRTAHSEEYAISLAAQMNHNDERFGTPRGSV